MLSQSRGIYLQIGNEINSRHYGTAISSWQGRGRVGPNSEAIIAVYTEYFLAPAVEALRDFDWGAETASTVHLGLGSVANAANPRSRAWLYDLLDYRIRGDFAPSLSGKRVVEIIDLASIHYLVTAADEEWLEILDSLKTRWIDSGLVSGVWGTEELGRRRADAGLGAMTAMKVTSRYLHWWSTRGVSPDQSRFLLWGSIRGQPGTTGDYAMELLHEFLGDSRISDVSSLLDLSPQANIEAYAFETVGEPGKRVIFLYPRPLGSSTALKEVSMAAAGWSAQVEGTAHVLSADGHSQFAVPITLIDGAYHLSLPDNFQMSSRTAIVLFWEAGPPR